MPGTDVHAAINLRLALAGLPFADEEGTAGAMLIEPVLARQRELSRRLADRLPACDQRIQAFLDDFLAGCSVQPSLPRRTLVLDQAGLGRTLSLPARGDAFTSPLLSSYRLANGVLHNPANDRRTTAGVFHIAEGGMAIPDDKLAVPTETFARLLAAALQPPAHTMVLPYTSASETPTTTFVSLLLRPLVVPGVPGYSDERRMETRFIVPGGLVANLDFVESIFGNGGDPYLPENDASLDPAHWTGTTGCVILAPHLTGLTKQELGLPHVDEASERQRRDGMCWTTPDEPYNGGQAFKVCARDARGVMVTIIADNYFGYCKKEVKTQISYSANLYGSVEEEHAGGAVAYPSYNLGQEYTDTYTSERHTFEAAVAADSERFRRQPEGHALVTGADHLVLIPQRATFSLRTKTITWTNADGSTGSLPMRAGTHYLLPDGYRVHMTQLAADRTQWSLIGTSGRATHCHKPSTVSGGGKSEISKAISDAFVFGNSYSPNYDEDMDAVQAILDKDYSLRFIDPSQTSKDFRPVLSDQRSIGSVIKLLTPSPEYTDAYNAWLERIPTHIKELVFVIKRFYKPEWGANWREHFTVGRINGRLGNALRLDGDKITVNMLRVGFETDGAWRLFGLRHDFSPAAKVQTEDDITASAVVPPGVAGEVSRKIVENCEQLLFQRPDDAIHRGYDGQAEHDIAQPGTFLSNFQPLTHDDAVAMRDDAIGFSAFTEPMRDLIAGVAAQPEESSPAYFVSSANPRLVNGKPSKNPRYLQQRPDKVKAAETATAALAARLYRQLPSAQALVQPVDVVAAGRRNNPPEPGVRPLCSFNPLHYLELPELFAEFISSMTGKSPSTTGAGSEGALTKGPFNALPAIIDLNAALLSYVLTGYDGWVSCAGYLGPRVRVDHDVSLLVPEVFSRMSVAERDARSLIAEGMLERLTDFEHRGKTVAASRLGYRMTAKFAIAYFGRIFMHPHAVFTEEMLRPELQDLDVFADSLDTIVTTHQRVAQAYFDDGTIELACPPLRALLEIMAFGQTADGHGLEAPQVRSAFERDTVLASDWYAARLAEKQTQDLRLAELGVANLSRFAGTEGNEEPVARLGLAGRLAAAQAWRDRVASPAHRDSLVGTLGRQVL